MSVTIAPWLHPTNFIEAMSAGAQAGLGARRADQESIEAGDRLRLAYDQLASSERREQEAAASKMQLAKASLALRGQQMQATSAYHQGQLDARSAADALHHDNMTRLASQFAEREQRMKEQFASSADQRDNHEERLASQFDKRMDEAKAREERLGKQFKERMSFNLDPASKAELGSAASELRSTRKQIDKIDDEGGPRRNWLGLTSGNTDTYKALKAREADLLNKIHSYKPAAAEAAAADETSGSDSPAPAQFRWDAASGTIKRIGDQ